MDWRTLLGQRICHRSGKVIDKFAFEELDLLRIYAKIYEYNIGSMKVLEKTGFEKEAIIKSSVIKEGQIVDEHLYSIRKK